MTLAAQLSADLRSKASYMPLCPLCSFIGHHDHPDILNGPSVREFHGTFRINHCCELSNCDQHFDSKAAASSWWRARRAEEHPDIATNERRKNTIAKLYAKNLEAIDATGTGNSDPVPARLSSDVESHVPDDAG